MNWKILGGGLIIFGAVSELISIWNDYSSGKLEPWPFGADVMAIIMIGFGIYLIRKGIKSTYNV